MKRAGRTGIGTDTVKIGPPEIVTHSGVNRRKTQRVAVVKNEMDVTIIRRRTCRPETGIFGGNGIHHGLCGSAAVEEVTPSKRGIRLRETDNELGTIRTTAHPVENVAERKGGIHRISGCVRVGGSDNRCGGRERIAVAPFLQLKIAVISQCVAQAGRHAPVKSVHAITGRFKVFIIRIILIGNIIDEGIGAVESDGETAVRSSNTGQHIVNGC